MPETLHATGTFEVKVEPPPASPQPTPIGRMSLTKVFSGDLEGTSRVEMLTAMTAVKGSAVYVAIEQVTATLAGRAGTFFLNHTGVSVRGEKQLKVSVVSDSGTGDLEGIEGTLDIRIEGGMHFYDLGYTLPAAGIV